MKHLSSEQIKNMSLKEAWDIAGEFGEYLSNRKPVYMEYESVLPYPKDIISLALVKILKYEDFSNMSAVSKHAVTAGEIKENIAANISLLDLFIPDEKQYKEMVEEMKIMNERVSKLIE
ncbi:MAG: hypothetical protein WC980_07565 [Candidatus Brocadiia bacterium]